MYVALQKRLTVELKLFNTDFESTRVFAVVKCNGNHRNSRTDKYKIGLQERKRNITQRFPWSRYLGKPIGDIVELVFILQQTTKRSQANLTWRPSNFLQVNVDFSHQSNNSQSIHTTQNTKKPTHHVCRRSLRTGHLRGLATQDRRGDRCQGCMWRLSSSEVNGRSNTLTSTAGYPWDRPDAWEAE